MRGFLVLPRSWSTVSWLASGSIGRKALGIIVAGMLAIVALAAGAVGTQVPAVGANGVTHFDVSNPTTVPVAGVAFSVTVTAKDIDNNVVTTYAGSPSLTTTMNGSTIGCSGPCSASAGSLGSWTNGTSTLSGAVGYKAETGRTLTVTDGPSGPAGSTTFAVVPANVASFTLSTIADVTAGNTIPGVTVSAFDAYANPATNYDFSTATVGSDLGDAPNGTGTHADGALANNGSGTATLSGAKGYETDSGRNLTVSDGSATGSSNEFSVGPAGLGSFTLAALAADPIAGTPFGTTVTAYDVYGNVKTNYGGGATTSTTMNASTIGCSGPCSASAGSLGSWTNGTSTLSGAVGYKAETGRTLTVTDGEGGPTGSSTFTVVPAALASFKWSTITTPVTANDLFSIEAKAFDAYDNLKTNYNASPSLSTLDESPNLTPSTFPNTMSFTGGVGTASGKAFKASAFATGAYVADQSFTVTDLPVSKTSGSFAVESAALDDLSFASQSTTAPTFGGGQPIDTKVNSVIYSACAAAAPGSADPCVAATSTPVKVLATDAYGNRKPAVSVGITRQQVPNSGFAGTFTGTQPKSTSDGSGTTPLGEAWFSDLKITTISGTATDRYTLTATSGSETDISSSFRVVSDLAQCTGQSKCSNNTTNNSVQKPENSFSQAKSTGGVFGNVITTTNFSDPALDVDQRCSADRTGATIGSAIDVRVIGAGLTTAKPTTTMVMIIKKETLKFYGLSARNAAAFNVCLGAMSIGDPNTAAWIGKDKAGKQKAAAVANDVDGLKRYWGVVADCSAKFINKTYDPCINLKVKSASKVAAEMTKVTGETWTVARVNSELNYFDSDVAIVINKPFPWDGKGGSY